MKEQIKFLGLFFLIAVIPQSAFADYAQEIRNHIDLVENRYRSSMTLAYFTDMGVIARKSDEATEDDLTAEIIGTLLFKRMDDFIEGQMAQAELLFETEGYEAVKIISSLNAFDKFYQPTDEYKLTARGQAFASELIRIRQNALDDLKEECSLDSILAGIRALRKTGLYLTNTSEEITSLRELTNNLNCCLSWKPKIHYYEEMQFETDYDEGVIIQDGSLKLKSSPRNFAEASWVGEWIYKFKGREGIGEGTSTVQLDFKRGSDYAKLKIGGSKLRSSGRINLPVMTAGEERQLEPADGRIFPELYFSEFVRLPVMGCHESKK